MKHSRTLILLGVVLLVLANYAIAKKPVDEGTGVPFGNGYPSGEHFNLNLIAKKQPQFTCPQPEYDIDTGEQIYGNVIFIPREQNGALISVLMESGRKGPKGAQGTTELQVTDWCTESFPDNGSNGGNGDEAVLRLPAHGAGYAVYARLAGKPGEDGDPNVTITQSLVYVEDEAGNNLALLGLVGQHGVTKFQSDGMTIYRTTVGTSAKGKGAQKATDLTPLFTWTGEVCYLQPDSDLYCDDPDGIPCVSRDLCCTDWDSDGIYEMCEFLENVGVPTSPTDPNIICPAIAPNTYPYLPLTAECKYHEEQWVFNIADFVGYLWNIDTTGAYVIKVRFYPL